MKLFEIDAIVEIPHGSKYKYEVNKKTGKLFLDRPLPTPLPYNYGYVPGTLHGDGDPLDVCIIGLYPIQPLAEVKIQVLGALLCNDNGASDDKLIAMVVGDNIDDNLKSSCIEDVSNYLSSYKAGFVVQRFVGPEEALEIVMKDMDAYQNEQDN